MATPFTFQSENTVKLSKDALDELLEPIPEDVLVEKIGLLNDWKTKRVPLGKKESKSEYLIKNYGPLLTLKVLRELRIIREHATIENHYWNIFYWDKSISRYYPDKIKKKFEDIIVTHDTMINVDLLNVNEEKQTLFLLLEQWQDDIVADTFLSQVKTQLPKYFRVYLSIAEKMLLVQEKSEKATANFIKIFEEAFGVVTSKITINAMAIQEFVKKYPNELTRLVIKVPQEVAGFGGLTELTLIGSDVIKGSKGLMDRHETSPILIGPWTGVSNKNLNIDINKPIKTNSIEATIDLFKLIKDL
ncbi:MAG: hypothetical protein FK734_06420 [Asgard group archaeon]|nr:hypothetical protein [Asgard group archaeon]